MVARSRPGSRIGSPDPGATGPEVEAAGVTGAAIGDPTGPGPAASAPLERRAAPRVEARTPAAPTLAIGPARPFHCSRMTLPHVRRKTSSLKAKEFRNGSVSGNPTR